MFFHQIAVLFHTLPGKIMASVFGLGTALLAVAEANSNQTLIIVAVITMFGTIFTGIVALINASRVATLSKGIDGVAHELKAAKEEGSVAKADAAFAKGKLEERTEQRGREGEAAMAKQDAEPAHVIIKNREDDPANVKMKTAPDESENGTR